MNDFDDITDTNLKNSLSTFEFDRLSDNQYLNIQEKFDLFVSTDSLKSSLKSSLIESIVLFVAFVILFLITYNLGLISVKMIHLCLLLQVFKPVIDVIRFLISVAIVKTNRENLLDCMTEVNQSEPIEEI